MLLYQQSYSDLYCYLSSQSFSVLYFTKLSPRARQFFESRVALAKRFFSVPLLTGHLQRFPWEFWLRGTLAISFGPMFHSAVVWLDMFIVRLFHLML